MDGWYDEGEFGPPTREDSMWFHEHVRAAGYPKVERGDAPMEGQATILCGSTLKTWSQESLEMVPSGVRCDLPAGHRGDHRMRFPS